MSDFAICVNKVCSFFEKQIPLIYLDGSRRCKNCEQRLKVLGGEQSKYDLDRYPTPLAIALMRLSRSTSPHERSIKIIEALTQLGKYIGLIGTSDYLRKEGHNPRFANLLTSKLARPHVSTWFEMMQLSSLDEDSFLPELATFWAEINTHRAAENLNAKGLTLLNEKGEEISRSVPLTPLSFLLNFRNTIAHKTSLTDALLVDYSNEAERALTFMLERLDWLWEYTLIARLEKGRIKEVITLRGFQESISFGEESVTEIVLETPQGDQQLLLLPFYVTRESSHAVAIAEDQSSQGEILVLEDIQERHLLYLSPLSGEGYQDIHHHSIWLNLLSNKESSPFELLAMHQAGSAELNERAHYLLSPLYESQFTTEYYDRETYQKELEDWRISSAPLCLVCAEGGMGKTTLLTHKAMQWSEVGHVVMWWSATQGPLDSIRSLISSQLRLSEVLDVDTVQEILDDEELSLIVIIDGLNESEQIDALISAIIEELDEVTPCKVLLSTRRSPTHEQLLARRLSAFVPRGYELTEHQLPHLRINALSYYELKGMWQTLSATPKRELFGQKIAMRPRFDLDEMKKSDEEALLLIETPLQLRLFLMLFNGKQLPKYLGTEGVFERFIRYLSAWPRALALLKQVAMMMWTREARLISTDELANTLRQIGLASHYWSNNGPLSQLIELQLLDVKKSGDKVSVSARVDGLIEHLIARELISHHESDPLMALSLPHQEHPYGEGVLSSLLQLFCARRFQKEASSPLRGLLERARTLEWPASTIGYALASRYGNKSAAKVAEPDVQGLKGQLSALDFSPLFHFVEELRCYQVSHANIALSLAEMMRDELWDDLSLRQQFDLVDELVYQYKRLDMTKEFEEAAKECLAVTEQLTDEEDQMELMARALNHVIFHCWSSSLTKEGLALCDRAHSIYEAQPERFMFQPVNTLYIELMLASSAFDFERSDAAYNRIKKLRPHDERYLAYCMIDVALIKHQQQNNPEEAHELLTEAHEVITRLDGPREARAVELELAYCKFLLGHKKTSLDMLIKLRENTLNDEEFPNDIKGRLGLYLGEVGKLCGYPLADEVIRDTVVNAKGRGDKLEVTSLMMILIHLGDQTTDEELDYISDRLSELSLSPMQELVYGRTLAWRALETDDYVKALELIESLYAREGITRQMLLDSGEEGVSARWHRELMDEINVLHCLSCWTIAMSSEHGLSDGLIVIFEELIASNRHLIAPLYQDFIRVRYALLLFEAKAVRAAEGHAQIAVENYAHQSMISDSDVSLAMLLLFECAVSQERPDRVEQYWARYLGYCDKEEVLPNEYLRNEYLAISAH